MLGYNEGICQIVTCRGRDIGCSNRIYGVFGLELREQFCYINCFEPLDRILSLEMQSDKDS
jgi:hypothetical protein